MPSGFLQSASILQIINQKKSYIQNQTSYYGLDKEMKLTLRK